MTSSHAGSHARLGTDRVTPEAIGAATASHQHPAVDTGYLETEYAELSAPIGTSSATFETTGVEQTITLAVDTQIAAWASFELGTQSGASASTIEVAFDIDGTVHDAHERYLSGSNDKGIGAIVHRSGVLTAGMHTVKLMFRRTSGVAVPGLNRADMIIMALHGAVGPAGPPGAGYAIQLEPATGLSPTDGASLFMLTGKAPQASTTSGGAGSIHLPPGTIVGAYVGWWANTAGSAENISAYVRKNDTTDYLIATVGTSASGKSFYNAALSIPISSHGDFFEVKLVYPTWATNPNTLQVWGFIWAVM